jgi:hypothetical protein
MITKVNDSPPRAINIQQDCSKWKVMLEVMHSSALAHGSMFVQYHLTKHLVELKVFQRLCCRRRKFQTFV